MTLHISVFSGAGQLAAALTDDVAQRLRRAPTLVLGLPTGRTPLGFYRRLVHVSRAAGADFSHATTFNLDEFLGVGPGEPGSYRQYMERHFFRHINIDRRRIHFLDGAAADPRAECERYEAAIAAAGGLDLQVLGIGANGHIGFNEPAERLAARTHVVRLRPGTRQANAALFGGDVARVPRHALSMGMATILHARSIVLMATGGEKAACVSAMVDGPLTTRTPASFLQLHPDVHVMLDQAAARKLRTDHAGG
jgi:glucosamine-6-phosphate deaminase